MASLGAAHLAAVAAVVSVERRWAVRVRERTAQKVLMELQCLHHVATIKAPSPCQVHVPPEERHVVNLEHGLAVLSEAGAVKALETNRSPCHPLSELLPVTVHGKGERSVMFNVATPGALAPYDTPVLP